MLQKINIQPGFNKQVTATGGEGQWVSGDYVRFRYGSPEKVGGWAQLGDNTLTGRNTALHHFANTTEAERNIAHSGQDFLSNGFKFEGTGNNDGNVNGANKIIYMAFAEQPFVTSTGVPCNAR